MEKSGSLNRPSKKLRGRMYIKIDKRILIQRLGDIVDQYRSMILDPVEQEFGEHPNWVRLRAKLLKALGERGLQARVIEAVESESAKYGEAYGN